MIEQSLETGEAPRVRIERVRGSLQLQGESETVVRAVSDAQAVELSQTDAGPVISARGSLRLQVPRGASLEIDLIGGDLGVRDVQGDMHVGNVGGDAHLQDCGAASLDRVGGDFLAQNLDGKLSLHAVGGDVVLETMQSDVEIHGAGGDVRLRHVGGGVDLALGGDVSLIMTQAPTRAIAIEAGGDVYCRLPQAVSVAANLSAGSDLKVSGVEQVQAEWGEASFEIGKGEVPLKLRAGSDLWLSVGKSEEAAWEVEDLGEAIAAKVGEKVAEMEAALSAMGAELGGLASGNLADRVERIVSRAVRMGERTHVHESLQRAFAEGGGNRTGRMTDEERLRVLKMLEEKKITVEEAETLLEALEN